jgi:hypothetical protein
MTVVEIKNNFESVEPLLPHLGQVVLRLDSQLL